MGNDTGPEWDTLYMYVCISKVTLDRARGDGNDFSSYAVRQGSLAYTNKSQDLMTSYQSHAQARLVPRCRSCPHDKSRRGTIPDTACAVAVRFLEDLRVSSRDVYHSQGSERMMYESHASVCSQIEPRVW